MNGNGDCLCLFMFVSYFKRCLFAYVKIGLVVGLAKQMSDDKEVDSELITLENHVDLTLFGRHDFSLVNNSLCLPPYHLIFV